MIDICSQHDNMHKNGMFYALICISNHIFTCINTHAMSIYFDMNPNMIDISCRSFFLSMFSHSMTIDNMQLTLVIT